MRLVRNLSLAIALHLAAAARALSQTYDPANGWSVTVYPIYGWVPLDIDIEVNLPDIAGGGVDPDGDGTEIIDSRFDGAYFGGIQATNGRFRIEADGLWAAVGGDRPEPPVLEVDVDAVYFHAAGSVRVFNDLYLGGGVRRLALKYDIRLADLEPFKREPGLWDPLVGLSWHSYPNDSFEFHANFDVGGFGVGSEFETSTGARVDWKPFRHVGLTAGYNLLYFKAENTVRNQTLKVKQTMHGPVVGIGLYF
jgi:hypothetical protein